MGICGCLKYMLRGASKGFTLVELITVMVLVGILSLTALPRFFDTRDFTGQGFYDELISAVRFGRATAVASGCSVQVRITSSPAGYGLFQRATDCTTGAFTRPVPHPSQSGDFTGNAPNGVTVTAATLTFDGHGRADADVSVTVAGSRIFDVVAATGYVRRR